MISRSSCSKMSTDEVFLSFVKDKNTNNAHVFLMHNRALRCPRCSSKITSKPSNSAIFRLIFLRAIRPSSTAAVGIRHSMIFPAMKPLSLATQTYHLTRQSYLMPRLGTAFAFLRNSFTRPFTSHGLQSSRISSVSQQQHCNVCHSYSRSYAMSAHSQMFKLALCQMHVTADKEANLAKARDFLRRAKEADAKIAVLPECFQCPYDTTCFRSYSESLPEPPYPVTSRHESPSLTMLQDIALETGMYIVGGSVPEISEDKVYNTSMTVSPAGELIAKHRKAHLFDIDVPGGITFKESDALTAGEKATAFKVPELSLTAGVAICYDMRFPELAMVQARNMKASLLIYPGAFNMTTGPAHWELLIRARALDNQVFVAACSPARATSGDGYKAWGHSMVVDPWGKIVAATEEKESVVVAEIDLSRVETVRKAIPTRRQRRTDLYTLEYLK
ncbi:unnamed protein product [Agarophyton chilense]